MTMWARGSAAAAMLVSTGTACAQTADAAPGQPRLDTYRFRAPALGTPPRGERDHVPIVAFERRTVEPNRVTSWSLRGETRTLSFDANPRSRVTAMQLEDRLAIGDRLVATIGWQGLKVSNRNVNAALENGDRLTAHDWFLPQLRLSLDPMPRLAMSVGYRETMRAYEGAGSIGQFGMSHAAFQTLRRALRPERARAYRLDVAWQADDLRLSAGIVRAALADPLVFADHSYQPGNGGSLAVSGLTTAIEHRLTSRLAWSATYRYATGRTRDGRTLGEREMIVGSVWTAGRWHGAITAAHAASPMLPAARTSPVRIEAAIDYTTASAGRRPVRLSMRLTDPSRLAVARLIEGTGAVRAADRARGVMIDATMVW